MPARSGGSGRISRQAIEIAPGARFMLSEQMKQRQYAESRIDASRLRMPTRTSELAGACRRSCNSCRTEPRLNSRFDASDDTEPRNRRSRHRRRSTACSSPPADSCSSRSSGSARRATFAEQVQLRLGRDGRCADDGVSVPEKLGTQVPLTMLGGPGTIATAAGDAASQGLVVAADLPHDAQRQPGGDQLPADSAPGRRAHGVSGLRRHPRPAGQRASSSSRCTRPASCSSSA